MDARKQRRLLRRVKLAAIAAATVYTSIGIRMIVTDAGEGIKPDLVISTAAVTEAGIREFSGREASQGAKVLAPEPETEQSSEWDAEDSYLLAKLAMAEAEGEDTEGKALVILVVLNRVRSEGFPDTVEDVIMEEHNGVRQFSVTKEGGRWYKVEPDEDCYKALKLVTLEEWDESEGALYFESRSDSTWHQNHLQFLFQHGKHYFYKEG